MVDHMHCVIICEKKTHICDANSAKIKKSFQVNISYFYDTKSDFIEKQSKCASYKLATDQLPSYRLAKCD